MKVTEFTGRIQREEVEAFLERKPIVDESALDIVRTVIAGVRDGGDAAVAEYTREFDGFDIQTGEFEVVKAEIDEAYNSIDEKVLAAIRDAHQHLKEFYEKIKVNPVSILHADGAKIEERFSPLNTVGVYVPGGRFPYPSTVLMNVIPAKVAGVPNIFVCSPPRDNGRVDPNVLVAANEAGADKIFKFGGAQAIAAFAYGTHNVPKVDKITGPGNVFVTMAKREVYGDVGIDMLAGPSEVLILADESAPPEFVAQDMKAQAEHDPDAQAILVTTSTTLANQVDCMVDNENMKMITVQTIDQAIDIANIVAPEHMEIMAANADKLADRVTNAGAIFVGLYTPTAAGDYIAGPNHTLPTSGTARFSSPLSVYDFLKRTSVIRFSKEALSAVADTVETMAETEGLVEHAKSVEIRVKRRG